MKNLRKIIVLFAFIFVTGIVVTYITVNTSLNKSETPSKASDIEVQKDTTYLLKAEKEIKTV